MCNGASGVWMMSMELVRWALSCDGGWGHSVCGLWFMNHFYLIFEHSVDLTPAHDSELISVWGGSPRVLARKIQHFPREKFGELFGTSP